MPFLISQRTDDDAPLGATASTRPSNVMNVDGPLSATSGHTMSGKLRVLPLNVWLNEQASVLRSVSGMRR
jgi:hypothetical protein